MPAIEIEILCTECGADLGGDFRYDRQRMVSYMEVPPCATCLAAAKQEGREEASKEGQGDMKTLSE